jgi:DNA-binding FadR family transcriptional regulator
MFLNDIFTPKQKRFLEYISLKKLNGEKQIPALSQLSQELGFSTSSLREILEMARTLGLIEAHPRSGIQLRKYSFKAPVIKSLGYALMEDKNKFDDFSELRINLEKAFFPQAIKLLTQENVEEMRNLVWKAKEKLRSNPIQIPHPEHRQLHLSIYQHIRNDFVISLLESYWIMYESIGLNVYTDFKYLVKVWEYHEKIVDEISENRFERAYNLLVEHMEFIKDIRTEK